MSSSKKALPYKRRSGFLAYPEDLHLEKREGHRHYDPRVHYPPVERDVKWMMKQGHGVHIPVLVEKQGDLVVVADGRQRVINATEANVRLVAEGRPRIMIPLVPKRGDAKTMFEIRVITNQHRQEDNPVVEAFTMQQYLDMGRTEEDCAELWGCTTRTVRNRLYLLELCPEVQQAVIKGDVAVKAAIALRDLSFKDQRAALKRKPAPKKQRRPSAKKVKTVLASNGRTKLPDSVRAAIQWAAGEITDEQAAKKIKGFKLALEATA